MRKNAYIIGLMVIAAVAVSSSAGAIVAADGTISGYVYTISGAPVAGEAVEAFPAGNRSGGHATTTDVSGFYAISVPPGVWKVRVGGNTIYAPEYHNGKMSHDAADVVTVTENATTTVTFHLALGAGVTGRVMDAWGFGQYNVRVTFQMNRTSEFRKEVYTDEGGWYVIKGLPRGILEARAEPAPWKGYTWTTRYIYLAPAEERVDINFKLRDGFLVSGYILDRHEDPVPDAWVRIGTAGDESFTGAMTDENGYYEVRVPKGACSIGIDDTDGHIVMDEFEMITGDTEVSPLLAYDEDVLVPVSGTVTNGGYSVTSLFQVVAFREGMLPAMSIDTLGLYSPIGSAVIPPAGGAYAIDVPLDMSWDLPFMSGSMASNGIVSATSQGSLLDVVSGSVGNDFTYDATGGTMMGAVTCNGKPVLMARVFLTGNDGVLAGYTDSDETGSYIFNNVPAGSYTLQARYEDMKSQKTTVTVTDGETAVAEVFFAAPRSIITGTVTPGYDRPQDDIIVNFGTGNGVWIWRSGPRQWFLLHEVSPETMAAGDIDGNGIEDVVVDFGADYGVWIAFMDYDYTFSWLRLHEVSPESFVVADINGDEDGKADIIVDFGEPYGVWAYYDNQRWERLNEVSPEYMAVADLDGTPAKDLVVDFGPGYGIWTYYNSARWERLHEASAKSITPSDLNIDGIDEIVVDFGAGNGLWTWHADGHWEKLHDETTATVVIGDADGDEDGIAEVIVDFGPTYGVWVRRNAGSWECLTSFSPYSLTGADIDGDALTEVIVDFGPGAGIFTYHDDETTWIQLYPDHAAEVFVIPGHPGEIEI